MKANLIARLGRDKNPASKPNDLEAVPCAYHPWPDDRWVCLPARWAASREAL